jgi:hypothetical protein
MKYFTYTPLIIENKPNGPDGFLPVNTTSSVFYNNTWFCGSEIENFNDIEIFNPIEISKAVFLEAYNVWYIPSGSI